MATILKWYFHDVASPNTGTLPGAGTAFGAGLANAELDTTGDATGARTARDATDTIGVLQASSLVTATANQLAQTWGHRRFVSRPLAAQTTPTGNWTLSFARAENNLNHNMATTLNIYAWRPGTGAVVGSALICSSGGGGTRGAEPTIAATQQAQSFVNASNAVTLADGDVLVFEIGTAFTQGKSSALTENFFYDGTVEGSATDCASFVTPPSALTLFTAAAATSDTAIFERASGRRRTLLRM
jgi:hypothetical protein